ncbi:hypothetical protein CONPUDRAFT_24058, partial [Coniophora puteana RWD-64-598 SS2]
PPRHTLEWDEVMEYVFLADFDLLRDTRQDISACEWAKPGARSAMDLHFKICCACKEITRLNVKVQQLATYLQDEEKYLLECEAKLKQEHPALVFQVSEYWKVRGRCNGLHWKRLQAISRLQGF